MKIKNLFLISVLVGILGIFSVNATEKSDVKLNPAIYKTTWETNYFNENNNPIQKKVTVTFERKDNKIFGNASCNTFNGRILFGNSNTLKTSMFVTTRMVCPGSNANKAEAKFLDKFSHKTLSYRFAEGKLILGGIEFSKK